MLLHTSFVHSSRVLAPVLAPLLGSYRLLAHSPCSFSTKTEHDLYVSRRMLQIRACVRPQHLSLRIPPYPDAKQTYYNNNTNHTPHNTSSPTEHNQSQASPPPIRYHLSIISRSSSSSPRSPFSSFLLLHLFSLLQRRDGGLSIHPRPRSDLGGDTFEPIPRAIPSLFIILLVVSHQHPRFAPSTPPRIYLLLHHQTVSPPVTPTLLNLLGSPTPYQQLPHLAPTTTTTTPATRPTNQRRTLSPAQNHTTLSTRYHCVCRGSGFVGVHGLQPASPLLRQPQPPQHHQLAPPTNSIAPTTATTSTTPPAGLPSLLILLSSSHLLHIPSTPPCIYLLLHYQTISSPCLNQRHHRSYYRNNYQPASPLLLQPQTPQHHTSCPPISSHPPHIPSTPSRIYLLLHYQTIFPPGQPTMLSELVASSTPSPRSYHGLQPVSRTTPTLSYQLTSSTNAIAPTTATTTVTTQPLLILPPRPLQQHSQLSHLPSTRPTTERQTLTLLNLRFPPPTLFTSLPTLPYPSLQQLPTSPPRRNTTNYAPHCTPTFPTG